MQPAPAALGPAQAQLGSGPSQQRTPSLASRPPPSPISSAQDVVLILNETDWPTWVREAFDFMDGKTYGRRFMRAVELWTVLERSYGWQSSTRGLSTVHRPPQIGLWLRVLRRSLQRSPEINDEQEYVRMWRLWWAGLQPEWRPLDDYGWPMIGGIGEWDVLTSPGKNGILIVLLSLVWWREVATEASWVQWDAAVEDVVWVLHSMVTASMCSKE
ncbi:hypothetical protein FKP32DRAFT_1566488 [Trametes sanguinea]|nr:hypothetical protein FKP32DRAFT_1566488 [Trametes sanguinea]